MSHWSPEFRQQELFRGLPASGEFKDQLLSIGEEKMDPTQYLAFIPLLIYGMGLTNVMSDWRRFFDSSQIFLPYILLSVVLTEIAIYNVFIYIRLISDFRHQDYANYLLYLVPPTIFYITTHVLTPDPGTDTKSYFIDRMRLFYILFAMIIGSHFLYNLHDSPYAQITRLVYMAFLVFAAIMKKIWISYLVVLLWLLTFLVRGDVMVN